MCNQLTKVGPWLENTVNRCKRIEALTNHKCLAENEHPRRGPHGPLWTWAEGKIYITLLPRGCEATASIHLIYDSA